MADDFKPKYYTEIEGNKRKIIAELPEPYRSKIMALTEKKVITSPHIIGNTIKRIDFEYFFNQQTGKAFVRFEVHKYSGTTDKNLYTWIELLIILAAKQIEGKI